jgi:hypothetical protein
VKALIDGTVVENCMLCGAQHTWIQGNENILDINGALLELGDFLIHNDSSKVTLVGSSSLRELGDEDASVGDSHDRKTLFEGSGGGCSLCIVLPKLLVLV